MRIEWKKREKGLKNEMTKCKRRRKWERRMCKRLQPTSFGLLSPQQLAPFKVAVSPSNPFCNILSGENTDTPCWKKNLRGSILLRNFSTFYFRTKRLEIIFGTFHSREFHLCLISAQQFSSLSLQELLILFIALPGMVINLVKKEPWFWNGNMCNIILKPGSERPIWLQIVTLQQFV